MPEESQTVQSLSTTPLTKWHEARGARLAEFAGYRMPVQYASIVAEHTATRQAAGLFDVSHMARLRFEGPRSGQLLDHLLTRRVEDMRVGQVRYSLMCNAEGGILDDVLVSHLESPSGRLFHLLVVNASNRQKIVKWLGPHLSDYPDVLFSDVTDSTAMIAVQGPRSSAIMQRLFPDQAHRISGLKYYRSMVTRQMQKPAIVSRTGYTGEDGFELIVRAEDAERVWENAMLAGREDGIQPAGLGARDTLRLEAGMPLYGHELSEEVDPLTAGLPFAVSLEGRTFVGSDSLTQISGRPLGLRRVGLKLTGRRAAREGAIVLDSDQRAVGRITSGTFSPTLQCPIAMAYLATEAANPGTGIFVDVRGTRIDAEIVPMPFYRSPTTSGKNGA
jgi:aminomethyltransferase